MSILLAGCNNAGTALNGTSPAIQAELKTIKGLQDQIRTSTSNASRAAIFARIVALYDQAALSDPTIEKSDQFKQVVTDYLASLNLIARDPASSAVDRQQTLARARFIAERLPDDVLSARNLFMIGRQQVQTGDYQGSADTITQGLLKIRGLTDHHGDVLRGDLARMLAHSVAGRNQAPLWAMEIQDPSIRSLALQDIARVQVTTGHFNVPELLPFRGVTVADLDSRGGELLQAAEALRVRGDMTSATGAAAAVSAGTRGRDVYIHELVVQAKTNTHRDAVEMAAFAISDNDLRDDAIAQMALGNIDGKRISIAERFAANIQKPSRRAEVFSALSAAYASSHVESYARASLKRAIADISMFTPDDVKTRVNYNLALTYLRLEDMGRAWEYSDRVTDPTLRAHVNVMLAETAIKNDDAGSLRRAISAIGGAGNHRLAARLMAALLCNENKPADLERFAASQSDVQSRAWALAYGVVARARQNDAAGAQRLLTSLDTLRAKATGVDDGMVIASTEAVAHAGAGDPDKAETYLPKAIEAGDDTGYSAALEQIAIARARSGNTAAIERLLGWTLNDDQVTSILNVSVHTLGQTGHFDQAAHLATEIPDYKARVSTMHKLALTSAQNLDYYKAFSGLVRKADKVETDRDLIIKATGYTYFALGSDKPGEALPALPNVKDDWSRTLSNQIPMPRDGNVFIIPMQYNYYNTKFISQVNNTLAPVGGEIFPIQAQGTRYPRYVHIDTGVFTLESLARRLQEMGRPDILARKGAKYMLNMPLLVGPDATLIVAGTDASELRLNSTTGTFIVNAGKLWFHDVEVAGWDARQEIYPTLTADTTAIFRPFIISWGGSVMNADRSNFHHLGFGGSKGYGFSYSQGPSAVQRHLPGLLSRPTGTLIENSFSDMYFGFFSFGADDVKVVGNEYKDNLIYGIDPHDYSRRLVVAYNTVYGSKVKHGIIGSRYVDDSWVFGNVIFGNNGSGVMMDRLSSNNIIYANRIWQNGHDGMTIYESPCNILASNLAWENGGDGVKVRNSTDVGVFHNTLRSGKGSGVNVYISELLPVQGHGPRDLQKDPYSKYVTASVIGNDIATSTGAKITATGFGAVALKDNRYVGAAARILGGDLAGAKNELLRNQSGGVAVRSTCPASPVPVCRFVSQNYLGGLVEGLPAAAGSQPMCSGTRDTDDADSAAGAADNEE